MTLPYRVPGIIEILAQPNDQACWATAFTMMKSWKDQASCEIATALGTVGQQYVDLLNSNSPLSASQFGSFLADAGMQHLAPQDLTIDGWLQQLVDHGPIWVGTMNSLNPPAGLHSRLVRGIKGDGTAAGTSFEMIDPDGGRTYDEAVNDFVKKYDDAYTASGDDQYIQIRFY
ncbi:papain-like cysteine protease family protein [Bradyrhizobium sp. HKCCYLRH2060]|uniref:papain-like cysteine protease family protein n=1 Tax=Bradyrhizobium TaxID=374 RepID=UPI002917117D|nr:papain-like cysteine protease family protein [Bradyrhizobium sp. SZCCHNR3003]